MIIRLVFRRFNDVILLFFCFSFSEFSSTSKSFNKILLIMWLFLCIIFYVHFFTEQLKFYYFLKSAKRKTYKNRIIVIHQFKNKTKNYIIFGLKLQILDSKIKPNRKLTIHYTVFDIGEVIANWLAWEIRRNLQSKIDKIQHIKSCS